MSALQRPVFASRPDLGAVGSVLDGRYRIEQVIGEGGMGVVAKATDLRLQRTVAVKMLHSEFADQEDVLERFAREAMVIAKLRSRHVVSVLDVSTDRNHPYLVLEHLEGESLEDRIFRDGPLPVGEAVTYCLQIAEALEEAHSAGILHRDIKPANVFLTRQTNGEIIAQILDFGTARFYDAKRDGQLSKPTLTKQFETFGSPAYMPPEQISSARNTDERSDIWALGTVLYEALTGRLAFEGEYPEVFVVISTREPPTVRSQRPEVPIQLESIIERCLRKAKEDRYASMTEVKNALLSIRQDAEQAAASVPHFDDAETHFALPAGTERSRARSKWLVIAAAVAAALLLLAVVFWPRDEKNLEAVPAAAPTSDLRAALPAPDPVQITPDSEALSPPIPAASEQTVASARPVAVAIPPRSNGKPGQSAIPAPPVAASGAAAKPPPALPAGPAIPSPEDIGRRK